MNEQQKDLLRQDLENRLNRIDTISDKLMGYIEFKKWIRKSLTEHIQPKLIMLGSSKQSLLWNFKDQINFPQKDFMEIIKCIDPYEDIYDEKLVKISRGNQRMYYIDDEHPKYKKFMLSVGLLDAFKKGYVFQGGRHNLDHFLQYPTQKYMSASVFEMYNSMSSYADNYSPSTIHELANSEYYINNILSMYDRMEQFGIHNLKYRIEQVLESEKSK